MNPGIEGVRAYVPWPDRPREPIPPTLRERLVLTLRQRMARIRCWWRGYPGERR